MRYRSRYASTDWYSITWSQPVPEAPSNWRDVTDIPGVEYTAEQLELPRTVWHLDAVADLCESIGVPAPQHNAARYSGVPIWEPVQPQLPHQTLPTQMLLETQRLLLADTMGTGKTRSAIQAAETVRRNVFHKQRPVVIVGPLRTRATWLRELLATGALASADEFCACESRDMDGGTWRAGAAYYFVHYDVIEYWWSRIYGQGRPCFAIADEVHHCKNGRNTRSKNTAMVLQTTPFRAVLTGTPIANKPRDLFAILELMSGTKQWGRPGVFRERYTGAYNTPYGLKDGEPTNVEELQERLEPFYLRRTPEDAGIVLPEFTRELVTCEPNPIKAGMLRSQVQNLSPEAIRDLTKLFLSGGAPAFMQTIKLLNRLRKGTSDLKREATLELARDVLESTGAVVVFCWMRETAIALQRALDDDRLPVTGDSDIHTRDELVSRFQRDGGALVATYGALADSVTLTRSSVTIHHDIDYVPSTMFQSEKRTHRISQTRGCKAYWMIAPDSLDGVLLAALRKKCSDVEQLFNIDAMLPEISEAADPNSFESRMARSMEEWKSW